MRIGINGFGRIGRTVFRILNRQDDIEVVAINDLANDDVLTYLLKYDTVMGPLKDSVNVNNGVLTTSNHSIKMLNEHDPSALPWNELGVDVVIESTGVFRTREQLQSHIDSGAEYVLLTVPAKDKIDFTVVIGVNEDKLTSEHKIISNASCTTNCLAPMAKVLNDAFEIKYGVINTVHAYTNDQRLADVPHSDWRRSRAAAENIIPTTTGAARAVGMVLPELKGKLDGIAMRVPVSDGSIVDLNVELNTDVNSDDVRQAVKEASETDRLGSILQYENTPIVSSDIIGNPYSSIFDAPFTIVLEKRFVKTLNWYDNEWGYSNRLVDLIKLLGKKM